MSLTLVDRGTLGLFWPGLSISVFKQGQQLMKYKASAKSGKGLEMAAALPVAAGALSILLLDGNSPIETITTFYVAAGVTGAFLDKVAGLVAGPDASTAINTLMYTYWKGKQGPAKKNIAGPTTANVYATGRQYDSNATLPRYPFASGQQYALHNDGGTTWANTRKKLFA